MGYSEANNDSRAVKLALGTGRGQRGKSVGNIVIPDLGGPGEESRFYT